MVISTGDSPRIHSLQTRTRRNLYVLCRNQPSFFAKSRSGGLSLSKWALIGIVKDEAGFRNLGVIRAFLELRRLRSGCKGKVHKIDSAIRNVCDFMEIFAACGIFSKQVIQAVTRNFRIAEACHGFIGIVGTRFPKTVDNPSYSPRQHAKQVVRCRSPYFMVSFLYSFLCSSGTRTSGRIGIIVNNFDGLQNVASSTPITEFIRSLQGV